MGARTDALLIAPIYLMMLIFHLLSKINEHHITQNPNFTALISTIPKTEVMASPPRQRVIPAERSSYLREISATVRGYHKETTEQCGYAQQYEAR